MWLTRILTLVQLLSAGAIIGLVLLQRGKGADAGAGFGAGASGTVFGARGATTALSRATAIFAGIFMLNSMGLAYLATRRQRDATGLLVFGDTVRDFVPPASRQGHLQRVLAALVAAQPLQNTSYAAPLLHLQSFLRRRGMVVVLSDFYAPPADIIRAVAPLRVHGNEVVLFQVLDPQELRPQVDGSSMLIDLETGAALEVSEDYVQGRYRERIDAHVAGLRREASRAGIGYQLMQTDQPLDQALMQYLRLRTGRD